MAPHAAKHGTRYSLHKTKHSPHPSTIDQVTSKAANLISSMLEFKLLSTLLNNINCGQHSFLSSSDGETANHAHPSTFAQGSNVSSWRCKHQFTCSLFSGNQTHKRSANGKLPPPPNPTPTSLSPIRMLFPDPESCSKVIPGLECRCLKVIPRRCLDQ